MTPTSEEWRSVVGFEGYYEVSDQGRVRSLDRVVACRRGPMQNRRGLVLKLRVDNVGRPAVTLKRDGALRYSFVSHLVMRAFAGERPAGLEICHADGNPANNRPSNLRYGTRSANNLDSVAHGTHPHARKTHCPRGHLLEEPNLRPCQLARGNRQCRACHLAGDSARRAKRAGRPYDLQAWADARYARIMEGAS